MLSHGTLHPRAADRILDGNLDAWVAERRRAGDSFNEIAFALWTDHQIRVSGETVRLWYLNPLTAAAMKDAA